MKMFRMQNEKGEDVLGDPVGEDNVYINTYGALVDGYKEVSDLAVDEITKKTYSLSGQKPTTYTIVRVS